VTVKLVIYAFLHIATLRIYDIYPGSRCNVTNVLWHVACQRLCERSIIIIILIQLINSLIRHTENVILP